MLSALTAVLLTAAPPEVAVLSTGGQAPFTELRFQRPGSSSLAPVAATLPHAAGATVTGVVLPGQRVVLAVTQPARVRDASFASALYRLEPGAAPRLLVDRVAVASRPFLLADGRVVVQRGRAGEARPGVYREDEVWLEEVDPASGATRTVFSLLGYAAIPAGQVGRALLLYAVDASGGRFWRRDLDSGVVQPLGPPFPATARDFVVDAERGRLLFTAARAPGGWGVFAIDASSGERTALARGETMALLPTVLPGLLAFQPAPGRGLVDVASGRTALTPRGPGFERVRFIVDGLALGLHERPSDFPTPFAVDLKDGHALPFPVAPDARLELAGVAP